MTTNKPFIFHGGNFIDEIKVRHRNDATVSGYDYMIEMGSISLSLTGQDLCDLVFSLATTAHDGGFIDDATARRLSYIGESYEASTIPTCDFCGVSEELSPLKWNGETGNHFFCEENDLIRPLPDLDIDLTDEQGEQYEEGR